MPACAAHGRRAQPMALQAMCHGESSPTYKELCTVTRQYANFMMLHCLVATPQLELYRSTNLETGERDCVPAGAQISTCLCILIHMCMALHALACITCRRNLCTCCTKICVAGAGCFCTACCTSCTAVACPQAVPHTCTWVCRSIPFFWEIKSFHSHTIRKATQPMQSANCQCHCELERKRF